MSLAASVVPRQVLRAATAASMALALAVAPASPALAGPGTNGPGKGEPVAVESGAEPHHGHLLPLGLEEHSPYLPQVSCDPEAKPGVRAFLELLKGFYEHGHSLGIPRACDVGGGSEHKEGRALDWGLDASDAQERASATAVLGWLLDDNAAAARRLGVMYIIWDRQIWGSYRAEEGWRRYDGPNPHTDHIHFSFGWSGAMKRTSWWTGIAARTEYGPCPAGPGRKARPYGDGRNYEPCPGEDPDPAVGISGLRGP